MIAKRQPKPKVKEPNLSCTWLYSFPIVDTGISPFADLEIGSLTEIIIPPFSKEVDRERPNVL